MVACAREQRTALGREWRDRAAEDVGRGRARVESTSGRTRASCAAPASRRRARIVASSVSDHPYATAGTTASGLNTANAAATTLGETLPISEPRLVKYAAPSGIASPSKFAGLAAKPSCS